MSGLKGKVAFISGVARGQGRSHAVRLAQAGVDIIGIDICEDIASMDYPNSSEADLAETVELVESEGRRMVGLKADVRDRAALQQAFDLGAEAFGRCDIVLANAGIIRLSPGGDDVAIWDDILDTNLTGVWNTVNVALPIMRAGGRGGVILMTSSTAGLRQSGRLTPAVNAYNAAKTGMVGLMHGLAAALAPELIRVNTIHPTGVATGMTMNDSMAKLHAEAAAAGANTISTMLNAMPIDILQPGDISDTVMFLVSDQAKWITGIAMPVDAGFAIR